MDISLGRTLLSTYSVLNISVIQIYSSQPLCVAMTTHTHTHTLLISSRGNGSAIKLHSSQKKPFPVIISLKTSSVRACVRACASGEHDSFPKHKTTTDESAHKTLHTKHANVHTFGQREEHLSLS